MTLPTETLLPLIDASASFVGLPPWTWDGQHFTPDEWLEGLILTESCGSPDVMRYEPHQALGLRVLLGELRRSAGA